MTTTCAVTAYDVVHEANVTDLANVIEHVAVVPTNFPEARSKACFSRASLSKQAGIVLICALLAGCGSSSLLGNSDAPSPAAAGPSTLPTLAAPVSQSRIALAPVMGAPDPVSKQVGAQLDGALERQRVSVAKGDAKPDYTLRGYMVATRERAGTKISYIFDLTDGAGKRVNRIQGEEMAQGGTAQDPWAALTPEISQRISDKTATTLASSLTSLSASGGGAASPPVGVGAGAATGAAPPPTPVAQATPPAGTAAATTGSIDRGATTVPVAIIPAVTGAPGDGNDALSSAMRQELTQSGITAATPGQRAYSVAGKVTVGPVKEGKQTIKIDWRVADPAGGLLATVSQNNEIQAGSLDGPWGNIASDAAQGAATRIKQLIDENNAGGGTAARPKAASAPRSKT